MDTDVLTAGIDIGASYTKAVLVTGDESFPGRGMTSTGFQLEQAAEDALSQAVSLAGISSDDIDYIITTGSGRYQVPFRDTQVTDLTAHAWGAKHFYPETRTVLDIGGQTMKASKLYESGRVKSFRLNDKCAAGTGAFLEKTAHYLGYDVEEIGELVNTAKDSVSISGVCAVFAESEVINHVSNGHPPASIMHGAIESLVDRSYQLLKRVRMEPEYTVAGGIVRFELMVRVLQERLEEEINVPPGDFAQFNGAIGAGLLGHRRLQKIRGTKQKQMN